MARPRQVYRNPSEAIAAVSAHFEETGRELPVSRTRAMVEVA